MRRRGLVRRRGRRDLDRERQTRTSPPYRGAPQRPRPLPRRKAGCRSCSALRAGNRAVLFHSVQHDGQWAAAHGEDRRVERVGVDYRANLGECLVEPLMGRPTRRELALAFKHFPVEPDVEQMVGAHSQSGSLGVARRREQHRIGRNASAESCCHRHSSASGHRPGGRPRAVRRGSSRSWHQPLPGRGSLTRARPRRLAHDQLDSSSIARGGPTYPSSIRSSRRRKAVRPAS